MKRRRVKISEAPATIPSQPRPIPDVEIPHLEPDLWGGEGGAGSYPGGPTGKPKDPDDDD